MKIAVIGTGRMGKALARTLFLQYKNQVVFAGRNIQVTKEAASQMQLEINVVTHEEAFDADIIIPALWYIDLKEWLSKYKKRIENKIVIDITNPFNANFDDFIIDYGTSAAEELQKLVPDTKIVGAFKNTYWVVFDAPRYNNILSDIYVTSNDEKARLLVIGVLKTLPFRVFDAGELLNNRTIERMTLLEKELATKAGNHPRVAFHLWGAD